MEKVNEKISLWRSPEVPPLEGDVAFEAAFADACAALREERLVALSPARVGKKRRIFTVAAVAAAAMLFAVGAVAAWPVYRMEFRSDRLYDVVENAPENVQRRQMEFTYLPEGYTLQWVDDQPEGEHYCAQITYEMAAVQRISKKPATMQGSILIRQRILAPEMGWRTAVDEPMTPEKVQELRESRNVFNSIQEITPEDIEHWETTCWLTSEYLYEMDFSFHGEAPPYNSNIEPNETLDARNEEILKILQGIHP